MMEVCLSIIIPTFNRAKLIKRTLESIISQTFKSWECIVVDDYSVDDTKSVIDSFISIDTRFIYILNSREKGAQGARNTGILASHAKWIILFDSDNLMSATFLERIYGCLNDKVDVCGCWSRVISFDSGQQVGSFNWEGYGDVHHAIMTGESYFDNSSTIIRKSKILDIGLLDENCPSFQEWDTHIRLSRIASYTTIREHLVDYYTGGKDTISKDMKREVEGYLYILSKYREEWCEESLYAYVRYCCILKQRIETITDRNESLRFRANLKLLLSGKLRIISAFIIIIQKIKIIWKILKKSTTAKNC